MYQLTKTIWPELSTTPNVHPEIIGRCRQLSHMRELLNREIENLVGGNPSTFRAWSSRYVTVCVGTPKLGTAYVFEITEQNNVLLF